MATLPKVERVLSAEHATEALNSPDRDFYLFHRIFINSKCN